MNRLLIYPHSAYVSRWPDLAAQLDTPENAQAALQAGPLYSAYLERTAPRRILRGVTVADWTHGVLYEIVAERRDGVPVLLRKTVAPYGSDTLSDAAQLSDAYLAVLAVDYWEHETPDPLEAPLAEIERELDSANQPRAARPSLERIAAFALDTQREHDKGRLGGKTREELKDLVPRHALSRRFSVSLQAADVWLRQARRAGLLPPASTGARRPRRNSNEGSQR